MEMSTTVTSSPIISRMSRVEPVRTVSSMNLLQSHTISSPNDTRPMPARMRTSVFCLMPLVFRHSHTTYFTYNQ